MSERQSTSGFAGAAAIFTLAAGLCSGTAACNAITGAGDLSVDPLNGGGGAGSTSAAAGTGQPTGSSAAGGTTMCVYPTTGVGNKIGSVVPGSHKWQGYAEHADMVSTISIQDFYDCDGSKNINALLIDESAVWCGACNQEASEMAAKFKSKWDALGVHVLTLMVDDAEQGKGATTTTALNWKTQYKLTDGAVAVDSALSFAPPGESTIGLPLQVIVDPRTMKIVDVQEGYSGDYSKLEGLAQMNQKK
jgi:hypothetical protein